MTSRKHEISKVGVVRGQSSQHHSFDDQDRCIEVEKDASVEMGGFQIRLNLGEVDILECLDSLDLYDDFTLYEQIQSMKTNLLPLKEHAYFVLPLEADPSVVERSYEGILVNALQKPRPQGPMNFNGGLEDASR